MLNTITHADSIEAMSRIEASSIDLIICDLPYGQTNNKWDVIIPFEELWREYERIVKPKAVICLFGQGMFTADMMHSKKEWWRYNLIYHKTPPSGFLNSKKMPMRGHEDICIFYPEPGGTYNPQMGKGTPYKSTSSGPTKSYGKVEVDRFKVVNEGERFPVSIIGPFQNSNKLKKIHPTQKPLKLYEYLIKTYSNENDLVLDNCCGSGTCAIACYNTNRNFICIEKDEKYVEASLDRLAKAKSNMMSFFAK